ncbi:MAG: 4Fe-4S binding protein [Anaerolineae bacterium]|nr:4Fe-4S binding protein [Anaerolineae bacterium]
MYGWGIIKTLAMTLYHFIMTYVEDGRSWLAKRRGETSQAGPNVSREHHLHGVFTFKYPAERRELPERYRNLPFFVIDAETEQLRCTACGICAQICPVQCIWIERAKEPETGRPRRYPISYYLDVSLCMSCGFCAEFCPFDAIKMDKDYELASYVRPGFVSAKDLAKPEAYHAEIHPAAYALEKKGQQG